MKVLNFIKDNWATISFFLALITSEIMDINPKSKAGSISKFIYNMIKKNQKESSE